MEALDRACMLVNMLECGDVVPGAFDHYPHPLNPQVIDAEVERINRRIACQLTGEEMEDILERLGFEVALSGNELSCTVPEWRMDFETDADFYTRNSLLYIDESDLDTIIDRVSTLKRTALARSNPFLVDLVEDSATTLPANAAQADLEKLQDKYFGLMATRFSNKEGTIRVVDIYPTNSHTDLKASRALLSATSEYLAKIIDGKEIDVFYTGKVYDTIRQGNTMLPEAKLAGKLTALLILLLYIINFYRQPQLIFISSFATALPILYTLALAALIYGRINLFTLLLALVLPGQACQVVSHVLKRYFLERARNLTPQLCIESAVLGIGPSTCAYSCIMAGLFACLIFVPLPGLQELAVLGTLGTLLNWVVTILVTTALLRVFQRKHPFVVNDFRINREYTIQLLPRILNIVLIVIVSAVSLMSLVYGSSNLKFFYDFKKTEIQKPPSTADSLLAQTGFPEYDPIIVKFSDEEVGKELYRNFLALKKKGSIPTIANLYTLAQFSPNMSDSRKAKLDTLQEMLTGTFLSKMDERELKTFALIKESLSRRNLDTHDQPKNVLNKFRDKKGNNGVFAFIFHNINNWLIFRSLFYLINIFI